MKLFQVVVLAGSVLLSACGGGGDETPTPPPAAVLSLAGWHAQTCGKGERIDQTYVTY